MDGNGYTSAQEESGLIIDNVLNGLKTKLLLTKHDGNLLTI